ncbi:MAG: pyruvate kinase [Phycisphaerae bacterium]|nr:pyruvate kinase [Phycisphaerae bacterium]
MAVEEVHHDAPPRTGIIVTLGPATDDPDVLERMVESGASIFRINFSHGEPDSHYERIKAVRAIEKSTGRPLAIMGDLPGPKIRLVEVAGEGIMLEAGQEITFDRGESGPCRLHEDNGQIVLGCTWAGLVDCVQPGDRVLIDDGQVRLLAVGSESGRLTCRVTAGGLITSHKGVNLPDSDLDIEVPTPKDRSLAEWAIGHDIDLLAMSFVRSASEIKVVRDLLLEKGRMIGHERPLPIIAKIEVPAGVHAAESIIAAADGVMVARGDLGVEMDLAAVPIIQKRLLSLARQLDRPCIVATQMLQSMVESPVPTRAEASDVAGAIFDGADAVMLSGETAVGAYPVVAVQTMRRICSQTESWMDSDGYQVEAGTPLESVDQAMGDTHALVEGIWSTAHAVKAKCIVVFSEWGTWSRLISRSTRPIPIVAYTSRPSVVRQMLLCRGVIPELMEIMPDAEILGRDAEHRLRDLHWLEPGDAILVVIGRPMAETIHSVRVTVQRISDIEATG